LLDCGVSYHAVRRPKLSPPRVPDVRSPDAEGKTRRFPTASRSRRAGRSRIWETEGRVYTLRVTPESQRKLAEDLAARGVRVNRQADAE
jgi:hypothetical protein